MARVSAGKAEEEASSEFITPFQREIGGEKRLKGYRVMKTSANTIHR